MPGFSLQQRLDAEGPLSPAELIQVGRQIASALTAAHAAGRHPTADPAGADDEWLRAVRVKVTSRGSKGAIKLEDKDSGELFAVCPLPNGISRRLVSSLAFLPFRAPHALHHPRVLRGTRGHI